MKFTSLCASLLLLAITAFGQGTKFVGNFWGNGANLSNVVASSVAGVTFNPYTTNNATAADAHVVALVSNTPSVLPNYVVTNTSKSTVILNSNLASITLGITNYYWNTLTVTGCVLYPFLNSTNWIFVGSNSCWMQAGKSNYIYYENLNQQSFIIAATNRTFDGNSGIWEIASTGPVLPVNVSGGWTDTNFVADTTQIIVNNPGYVSSTAVTNFYFRNTQNDAISSFGQVNPIQGDSSFPIFVQYDAQSNLLYQFQCENQGSFQTAILRMYGRSLGQTPSSKIAILRIKGIDSVSGKQGVSINGRMDATMTNGAELSFDITAPGDYGNFSLVNPFYINGRGCVLLGNTTGTYNPDPEGNFILDPVGFVTVAPANVSRPQMVLQGSPPYTGAATNGMLYSDGTNIWATQNGVTGKLATSASATSGRAVLAAGSNQVSSTAVSLTSQIFLTYTSKDGTTASVYYRTNEILPGSKFTIRSSNSADTNLVNWFILP